jgi:AhpC/TSA family
MALEGMFPDRKFDHGNGDSVDASRGNDEPRSQNQQGRAPALAPGRTGRSCLECESCWNDIAALQRAYSRYHDRGLVILGVGVQDTARSLRQIAMRLHVTLPVGYDENGSLAARPYAVQHPHDGVCRCRWNGEGFGAGSGSQRHAAEVPRTDPSRSSDPAMNHAAFTRWTSKEGEPCRSPGHPGVTARGCASC